ncbi:MAG: phosphotransferase [Thermoanaerobaculales bacterium]|nr:phosphotransferase [Thermoanaerobaculales bacterium]
MPPHPLPIWRRIEPLTGDASDRRYSRLRSAEGRTAILVEYPRAAGDRLVRDLEVLAWCRDRGLRVPDELARDPAAGRAVLEDLGPDDAEHALGSASSDRRPDLVGRLLEPLAILARCDPAALPPWNPPLDRGRLRWELAGFELWFVRHHRSRPPSSRLGAWLDDLAAAIDAHPRRVCHRDYHLNNLLVDTDGTVGVIDVQDILVGPDTYDIASLLGERAATRLLTTADRREALDRWARLTGADPGWRDRAEATGLQRALKVLGTFARFTASGRPGYRSWLDELAAEVVPRLAAAGAPGDATALLLD